MTATMDETLEPWKGFRDVVGTMNQTIETLKSQKEMSQQARKTLMETTKSFKKVVKNAESKDAAAIDSLTAQAKLVVKAYQEEIDSLTRRCKAAEQGYSSVFTTLQQLPDPLGTVAELNEKVHSQKRQMDKLVQTVDKLTEELEVVQTTQNQQGMNKEEHEELIQLRKEVAEYEVEFRTLKNQDITIRKLEEKIVELQTEGAETLQKSVEKARDEFALNEGRRVAEALEREASMEAKVRSLELQLKAERGSREATENVILLESEGLSRREAAWEVQRQIIVDDHQRVQEQLQTALRENEHLRSRASAAPISSNAPASGVGMQDLVNERNAYQAEVGTDLKLSMVLSSHHFCMIEYRWRSWVRRITCCERSLLPGKRPSRKLSGRQEQRLTPWSKKRCPFSQS
jgi:homeobox protein cut-like